MAFRSNGPINVMLPPFRGVTRRLILLAVGTYFVILVAGLFSHDISLLIATLASLQPVMAYKLVWQVVTYPFVSTSLLTVLFASLSVWFFGAALEDELGSRWLAEFFLAATIGGALIASLVTLVTRDVPGLGPYEVSGGLWPFSIALLVGFAAMHPDQQLNFNFILHVKAKYLAIIYVLIYLAVTLSAHARFDALLVLTNTLAGWIFVRFAPRRGVRFAANESAYNLRNTWARARRRRAAKKFSVYMQKQGREVHFDESGRYLDPDAERRDPNDRKWMN